MNTTIDLKTAKTIEAMNQKIDHMDNAVTDFFNKMSDVLERQLGDDEVYAAVIAPEIELTITPLANVRSYLPCFDEADSCYSISEDVPLALCYDPRQVITLAGKRYLSGAVVFADLGGQQCDEHIRNIGKNELFDVDFLHRSSSFRFVLSTTAA